MRRDAAWFLVFALSLVFTPGAEAREGFGFSKKAVELDRRVPPEVVLFGERISVRVADDGGHSLQARKLRDLLEESMVSYDTRLRADADAPQIVVALDVREVMADESWKQKTEYENRQVGTKVEYDSKGNKKEKPVYKSVPIQVNYKDVRGSAQARYRVTDARGTEIHAGNADASWDRSYKHGEGAPMASELEKKLIEQVAQEISAKLVGAREPVRVLVPRGSFDRLVATAEQGRWEEYLRQVEGMGALRKPAAEAYRQYAMGVAKEALAYESSDEQNTLELLQSAAEHYRQAVAMNGREKLFAEAYSNMWSGGEAASPLQRVESGVTNYTRLVEHRQQRAAMHQK